MKFAVLDFETTGSTSSDRIIQVGLYIIQDQQMTDRYTSLVNPGISIPSSITALTGISDDMVSDALSMEQAAAEMVPLLQDAVLVGHNVGFDLAFLQRLLDEHGYFPFDGHVLDTMDFLRILFPGLPSLQLSLVCQSFGIVHERPHQADSDAEVTALLWLQCLDKLQSLPLLTLQRLELLLTNDDAEMGWFLGEIRQFRELHEPVDQENDRYFRQFALGVGNWDEGNIERSRELLASFPETFEAFNDQLKASLRKKFQAYEEREAQTMMQNEVVEAFEESRHLLIEAGTGTGKSLGYLVPSLYYGLKHETKVLVSTHTINLQEQLMERDIPLLTELFPVPIRTAVLKGRSHYLCLRKFEYKINTLDLEGGKEERMTAAQMVVWLGETKHGDDEELHFHGRGPSFWQTVSSDADSCLNKQCPWFKKCFYHRAKYQSNAADVVITNHSLLFTDTQADNRILPSYNHLVIDEAHHFEEVAGKHLGLELHYHGFVNVLLRLFKDSRTGQLSALRLKLSRLEEEKTKLWCETIDSACEKLVELKEQWDQFAELLFQLLSLHSDPAQSENNQLVLRIRKDGLPKMWNNAEVIADNMQILLKDALKKLETLVSDLKETEDSFGTQSLVTDLGGSVKDLQEVRDTLQFFMSMSYDNYVHWIEGGPFHKSRSLQLHCAPIDVSDLLQQYFFNVKESIVMTSATLSVGRSFDYTCEQLGLKEAKEEKEEERLRTVQLPSPFNYRKQALVVIPRDFPSIRGIQGEQAFIERLVRSLAEVALETRGKMLVLFTSNRMLKAVHAPLKEMLASFGIQVLGQGVDSSNRSKLTRLFQSNPESVLLGTSSFWEGVDIPGEALTCLAIVRLPFQPPNHPLVEAKIESLKKKNMNPFMKLSVPQAVIRFKQGFGRLVRTASDKGIVVIYDTRVIDTNYGKYFLYSLPGPKIEHMSSNQLVPRIKQWMEENGE